MYNILGIHFCYNQNLHVSFCNTFLKSLTPAQITWFKGGVMVASSGYMWDYRNGKTTFSTLSCSPRIISKRLFNYTFFKN